MLPAPNEHVTANAWSVEPLINGSLVDKVVGRSEKESKYLVFVNDKLLLQWN